MDGLRIVACERCSRRKQRCDRNLPSCLQCTRAHVTCRNGKGEAVMVRRGLGAVRPKSFLEILEGRLSELGAMAKEHGIPIEAEQGDPPTSVAVTVSQRNDHISETEIYASSNLEPSWPEAPDGTGSAQATNTQQEDPTGWRRSGPDIGLLSLSAMAEPKSRASEFLKGISMPGIISAITQSYGGNPEATTRIDALWDEIGKDIRQSVGKTPQRLHLPKEDALTYVSRYYDVVDYRYPHLPRQEVMRGISAITAPEEGDYERTLASDPAKVFMAYMVLAITPLVSDTYPVAQASFISIHILSKALKILDKVFQLEDGVDIIHCLTLLVVFSLHSSAAGSTWHLAGVTMKKCIALGFHREVIASQNELPIEEMEQRRWAFWSCYFLDRLISSALDRPYGISDKDINIELPGSRAPFSSALTSIQRRQIHLYRYAILQSKIYKDRYLKPFSYHLSYLLHWKTSAPTYPDLYPIHQEEHLTSLYNTLCLRALTYSVLYPSLRGLDGAQDTDSWRLGMSQRSQAVIRSLNRAGMKRRSTLSWITAYSAVRATLGLLYYLVYLSLDRPEYQLQSEKCLGYITTALDILSVVARQFPIMQEYCTVFGQLRQAIEARLQGRYERDELGGIMEKLSSHAPDTVFLLVRKIVDLLKI